MSHPKQNFRSCLFCLALILFGLSIDSTAGPRFIMAGKVLPIMRIGSAVGTTSATIPAHLAGDLIVIFAFRSGSTTAPSTASGYTSLDIQTGTSCIVRIGYKIATSTNDTSGTWTNATELVAVVYRGNGGHIQIGNYYANAGTTNTLNYGPVTLNETNGTSVVVGFAGHRSTNQNLSTPPAGMTNFASAVGTASVAAADTLYGVTNWASTNVSLTGTASGWVSYAVEIVNSIQYPGAFDIQNLYGIEYEGGGFPQGYSFSNGDKTVTSLVTGLSDAVGVDGVTGKRYFEAVVVEPASGNDMGVASGNAYCSWDIVAGVIATDKNSSALSGFTAASGSTIAGAIDMTNGLCWYRNVSTGGYWNNSATANPATGTGGMAFTGGSTFFFDFYPTTVGVSVTVNSGKTAFTGTIPTGFSAWAP